MEIKGRKVILDITEDYEFIYLIHHVVKLKYGNLELKVKRAKPYQVTMIEKNILLSKDIRNDLRIEPIRLRNKLEDNLKKSISEEEM